MKSTTPKRIKLSRGNFFEIKLGGIGKIKSKKVAFSRSQKLSDALDVQLRTLCILPKREIFNPLTIAMGGRHLKYAVRSKSHILSACLCCFHSNFNHFSNKKKQIAGFEMMNKY